MERGVKNVVKAYRRDPDRMKAELLAIGAIMVILAQAKGMAV